MTTLDMKGATSSVGPNQTISPMTMQQSSYPTQVTIINYNENQPITKFKRFPTGKLRLTKSSCNKKPKNSNSVKPSTAARKRPQKQPKVNLQMMLPTDVVEYLRPQIQPLKQPNLATIEKLEAAKNAASSSSKRQKVSAKYLQKFVKQHHTGQAGTAANFFNSGNQQMI